MSVTRTGGGGSARATVHWGVTGSAAHSLQHPLTNSAQPVQAWRHFPGALLSPERRSPLHFGWACPPRLHATPWAFPSFTREVCWLGWNPPSQRAPAASLSRTPPSTTLANVRGPLTTFASYAIAPVVISRLPQCWSVPRAVDLHCECGGPCPKFRCCVIHTAPVALTRLPAPALC